MYCKKLFVLGFFLFLLLQQYAQENNISSFKIVGNKRLKTAYLERIIATKEGIALDSSSIARDLLYLKRIPAVSNAYFIVKEVYKEQYQVEISIEENFTILPELNFWTTTNKQFSYKLGLYDYNFLGRNIALGGFYQNNGFNSYGLNFRAPNLFSKKWGLAVNHQNWNSEEPLYFEDKTANYLYINVSFEVLGLYQLNLKNTIDFGLNLFSEKYKYISGDTDVSVPQELNLNKALLKLVYTYNNLEYFYQYVSGFKSVLFAEYVVTENDFQNSFLIAWNDFLYYRRIGGKGNWANRLRFGLASNQETPFAPFALDNNVNLRGVGILVDRGTGVAVLNSEYRHTIYDKQWLAIQTNVFSDFGSWRNPGGKITAFFEKENVRIFSGIGLRFMSKKVYNATFRIDYGFRVLGEKNNSNGGFVFGIGQYF